ncbi:hypothetical protein JHK84_027501 [Glycine max]|nr:hypothetical protein JHK84_027501 [Glycine max]
MDIFQKIIGVVNNNKGEMYFLDGYGRTGKPFMWKTLSATLHAQHNNSICNIHQGSELPALLKMTRLIFWDEALMAHKFCFEALEKSLRDIMKNNSNDPKVFRGKVVVFGGDFRQIFPIIPRESGLDIVCAIVNASYLWDRKISYNNDGYDSINIPPELLIFVFIDSIVTILASAVEIVHKVSEYILSLIPREQIGHLSFDFIEKLEIVQSQPLQAITSEFLNTLSTSGLASYSIQHKVGCPIMLLRNLYQAKGLCNGARMIVTRLANHVIKVKLMSTNSIDNLVYIPQMSMSPSQMSYVVIINKSQDQSLACVRLYLPRPVFSHGQLYMEISRVQSKQGLKILIHDKDNNPLQTTTNVVFKEILQSVS